MMTMMMAVAMTMTKWMMMMWLNSKQPSHELDKKRGQQKYKQLPCMERTLKNEWEKVAGWSKYILEEKKEM